MSCFNSAAFILIILTHKIAKKKNLGINSAYIPNWYTTNNYVSKGYHHMQKKGTKGVAFDDPFNSA